MGMEGHENPQLGQITDVNMWNSSLSVKVLKSWTSCEFHESGNMLDWNTAKLKYSTFLKELTIDKNEICRGKAELSHFIVSKPWIEFDETLEFYDNILGGQIAVVSDNATLETITDVVKTMGSDVCHNIYTGFRKKV